MFDLLYNTIFYGSFYGLSNIAISSFDILLAYIIAILSSILMAIILKVQLLPNKPYRYSFNVSAIYPTPLIAIGVLSIFLVLNYTFLYNGLLLAIIIGILSALFVKYCFDFVFPKPLDEDDGEDI